MSKAITEQGTLIDHPAPPEVPSPGSAIISKPASEGGMLPMIERLAANKDFDVEKLKELVALQERILDRNNESAFNIAMSQAQTEMRPVAVDMENTQTKSEYASYAQIDRALRPIYSRHGFALSFDTGDAPGPDLVRVLCYVTHTGGHRRTYKADLPSDGKGAKGGDVMTKTHATGAAMSYGMRYLLKMIFNVAVGEEDTDGNMPGDKPPAPEGFDAYWKQLADAAEKGVTEFEAVWACSMAEPYKTYRNYLAQHGRTEWEALKVRAKQVKK